MKYCKKCGNEMDDAASFCPSCGTSEAGGKPKKSIFKRWWFWVIIAVVLIGLISCTGGNENDAAGNDSSVTTSEQGTSPEQETDAAPVYAEVDLQTMLDDLDANALKAEATYQNKLICVTGKIMNFDSDGSYITIEPVDADDWNFSSVMCKMQTDDQRNFLLEKVVGDTVTVKGEITSIGEVLGYTMKIHEIT